MPFAYRLEDYARYRDAVGEATYIDISRRTDPARIPRLWDHLGEVFATYGAPWIVQLWTKDVAGCLDEGGTLLRQLREAGTTIVAQVTVTGLASTEWEPLVPRDVWRDIPSLAEAIGGPDHIKWRYDPIISTVHDPVRFRELAGRMADQAVSRGVINFVAPPGRYVRVDRRLSGMLPGWLEGLPEYGPDLREAMARELVEIATAEGISLSCCAEYAALADTVEGLGRAACGDHDWFAALSGRNPARAATRGSRSGCGCARYFDVGTYGQWARCHRCAYCYAG